MAGVTSVVNHITIIIDTMRSSFVLKKKRKEHDEEVYASSSCLVSYTRLSLPAILLNAQWRGHAMTCNRGKWRVTEVTCNEVTCNRGRWYATEGTGMRRTDVQQQRGLPPPNPTHWHDGEGFPLHRIENVTSTQRKGLLWRQCDTYSWGCS